MSRAALLTAAVACLAGCEPSKPEPPYQDPPPNQRLRGQALMVQHQSHDVAAYLPTLS